MKLKQKLGIGLFSTALLFAFIFSAISPLVPTSYVKAAGPPPGSLEEKLNGCAIVMAAELAGGSKPDYDTNCRFFDNVRPPSECGVQQLYGNGAFELSTAKQVGYKLPYREGGYNDPKNPPQLITLVEGDQTITPPPGVDQFKYANFTYTGQMYETFPAWKLDYWVYQSNHNTSFKILLALRPSGDAPVILTMVNTSKNVNGDDLPVCAYPLNLTATLSTPSGGIVPPGNPPGGGGTGDASDEKCYSSGWALSWLACPVITAAQMAANAMYGFVEDQLKFTVSQNGAEKDSLGTSHDSVHSAWSNFRILVSGLVVILLLVMVISQAIGSGPFDAYTVKKMLPRLVIGVILIQVSWPVFSFVINVVNRLGVGIADLMYAPFGGANTLALSSVMAPFHTEGMVFGWVGIPALLIFGFIAPFVVLTLILTVLAALFVGFLTLLFRKILIIIALIFVPVALISWMMPNDGLRIYWKKWWENFSKALMMFPLIIAIIAAGRIFAKIGGAQADFVGFFIVLVGFFGPLFILPKTFKWGGTVMALAGGALQKAQERGLKKPKEFLTERQKGYSEERTRQSRERYLRGEGIGFNRSLRRGFGMPSLWRMPIDRIKAGQYDPTLWGRRKDTAMRQYRAAGAESEEADMKAADQEFGLLAAQSRNHDEFARLVGDAQIGQTVSWTDRYSRERRMRISADMKRAGMNGMAKYGTDRTFRTLGRIVGELKHGTEEEQIMAERFLDAQVGTLKPKMDFLYRGQSRVPGGTDDIPDWVLNPDTHAMELSGPVVSRIQALNPEAFATMEAPELETLLAGLSRVANHHADPAARAEAEGYLGTIYTHYEAALDNDQVRRAMGPSLNQTMKAHLDGTNLAERNAARTQAGLAVGIEQVPATATPGAAVLAGRIGADGTAH